MNKLQKDNALLMNHMGYQHENPPEPFNPEYKPYASMIFQRTVEVLQETGVYDSTTLKERQESNVFRTTYDKLMSEYEAGLS